MVAAGAALALVVAHDHKGSPRARDDADPDPVQRGSTDALRAEQAHHDCDQPRPRSDRTMGAKIHEPDRETIGTHPKQSGDIKCLTI